jgi:ketosteroid isomerase-like protein
MVDDELALRDANALFYKTLETLDLPGMEDLWLHEEFVRCVHPGWDVLVGWEAVRDSFEQIFEGTRWIRVTPTAVDVLVFGAVGLVACTENITDTNHGDVGLAVAQATNVFQRVGGKWRIVVHHASPAPVEVTQPFSGSVQ